VPSGLHTNPKRKRGERRGDVEVLEDVARLLGDAEEAMRKETNYGLRRFDTNPRSPRLRFGLVLLLRSKLTGWKPIPRKKWSGMRPGPATAGLAAGASIDVVGVGRV